MNWIEQAKQLADGAEIITDWLGSGAETVSPEEAQRRADICLACPLNVNSGAITDAVAREIKRQVQIKNKLRLNVEGEDGLGKCAACLCETKLKIWLPMERVKPEPQELEKFHENCWLRAERL